MGKLKDLQGPHYDIPDRRHHFSEIDRSIDGLKEMNAPVYNSEYKHTYEPNQMINPDLKELVGPHYHVNTQHNYQQDFCKETLSKETHGPVFKVERKHGYGADFSVRHRTASPCAGPVMNVERKHNFADQGQRAIKSDLSSMVGPIYNSGKATKHNFSGGHGYVAPKGARADQQELVNKFFSKKSEQSESFECVKSEVVQVQQKVESKVEFSSGEDRRKEALERRQEFLKQNEDLHMQIKSSDFKMTNVKTRQQLEEERESFFKNTVLKVQQEAQLMSSRAKDDEMKRIEYLKSEEERIKREEILRQ